MATITVDGREWPSAAALIKHLHEEREALPPGARVALGSPLGRMLAEVHTAHPSVVKAHGRATYAAAARGRTVTVVGVPTVFVASHVGWVALHRDVAAWPFSVTTSVRALGRLQRGATPREATLGDLKRHMRSLIADQVDRCRNAYGELPGGFVDAVTGLPVKRQDVAMDHDGIVFADLADMFLRTLDPADLATAVETTSLSFRDRAGLYPGQVLSAAWDAFHERLSLLRVTSHETNARLGAEQVADGTRRTQF